MSAQPRQRRDLAPRVLAALLLLLITAASRADDERFSMEGKDLSFKTYKTINLKNVIFDKANLSFADFDGAVLTGSTFKGANLQFTNFNGAILDDADFTGADLRGATFHDARLWHAKMAGLLIELPGYGAKELKRFDVSGDDDPFQRLRFQTGDAGLLSFHYADLRSSVIVGNADGVDFRGADLRGTDLSNTEKLKTARFGDAKYDAKTKWPADFTIPKNATLVTTEDPAPVPTPTLTPAK